MKFRSTVLIMAGLLVVPSLSAAADKTHQQLMAEIRMLQEQQAQLQQMLGGLADTLKTMTDKMDDQTGAMRKAFADQALVANGIAEGVRILREKSDDTNVRLATMTQEIESMREAIRSIPARAAAQPGVPGDPDAPPSTGTVNLPPSAGAAWNAAWNDYTAGQYDLAVEGFEFYLKEFPNSPRAADAQLNIGYALYLQGNYKDAVTALQRVVTAYPDSAAVPQAYFKLGQSYEALKQPELARKAYETVINDHPTAPDATLAKQRLDSLNRK